MGMERQYSYSVCLASYNGAAYIRSQIESIERQLSEKDEIIVSDDGSSDNTLEIVNELKDKYHNITIIDGPHMGYSCNFGNAAKNAKNDIVLFSDQDDIWEANKFDEIDKCFSEDAELTTVLHSMSTFRDNDLTDTKEIAINYNRGVTRNFIKSCYWGCCMAVKRDFLIHFLPFRDHSVGHDQLIGLLSEKYGKCKFLDKKLINHRLHGSNTSGKRTVKQMIDFRRELIKDYKAAKKIFTRNKEVTV